MHKTKHSIYDKVLVLDCQTRWASTFWCLMQPYHRKKFFVTWHNTTNMTTTSPYISAKWRWLEYGKGSLVCWISFFLKYICRKCMSWNWEGKNCLRIFIMEYTNKFIENKTWNNVFAAYQVISSQEFLL